MSLSISAKFDFKNIARSTIYGALGGAATEASTNGTMFPWRGIATGAVAGLLISSAPKIFNRLRGASEFQVDALAYELNLEGSKSFKQRAMRSYTRQSAFDCVPE
jgi:hypothetical protein